MFVISKKTNPIKHIPSIILINEPKIFEIKIARFLKIKSICLISATLEIFLKKLSTKEPKVGKSNPNPSNPVTVMTINPHTLSSVSVKNMVYAQEILNKEITNPTKRFKEFEELLFDIICIY